MSDDFLDDDPSDDFLDGAAAAPPWTATLETARGEVLDWASAALWARHAGLSDQRGAKGVRQMRQDLDLHLRQLLASAPDQAAAAMADYRRWLLTAIWQQRPAASELASAQAAVLAEALVRFAPWPVGLQAAEAVAAGMGAPRQIGEAIAQLLKMR